MGSLDHKWIELDQNRSKRIIIDQNGSKWIIIIKIDQNGSKWIKIDQNGSQWIIIGQMDINWSKWIKKIKNIQQIFSIQHSHRRLRDWRFFSLVFVFEFVQLFLVYLRVSLSYIDLPLHKVYLLLSTYPSAIIYKTGIATIDKNPIESNFIFQKASFKHVGHAIILAAISFLQFHIKAAASGIFNTNCCNICFS